MHQIVRLFLAIIIIIYLHNYNFQSSNICNIVLGLSHYKQVGLHIHTSSIIKSSPINEYLNNCKYYN